MGLVLLRAAPQPPGAATAIEGRVRVQGAGAEGHGGVEVDSIGTPFTTRTTAEGLFRLEVSPEPHTLRFRRAGYGTVSLEVGNVAEGQTQALAEDVLLQAEPGGARGRVSLDAYGDAALVQRIEVALLQGGEAVALEQPGPEGDYLVPQVAPGAYTLRAAVPGYQSRELPIEVRPGAITDAPDVILRHHGGTALAVPLSGRITLADQPDASGTEVQVRFADRDLAFELARTEADGNFSLPASPDERYRLQVVRPGYQPGPELGPVGWVTSRTATSRASSRRA